MDKVNSREGQLVPFGAEGSEHLDYVEGQLMGIREAVWRGHLTLERGKSLCPDLDWSVIK